MIRTLYARLALVLVVLFISIGLLYALISTSSTRHYLQEVSQQFNKDLARNLVSFRAASLRRPSSTKLRSATRLRARSLLNRWLTSCR